VASPLSAVSRGVDGDDVDDMGDADEHIRAADDGGFDDDGASVGDDIDRASEGGNSVSSSISTVSSLESRASAAGADADGLFVRSQRARALLTHSELAIALDIFGLIAQISSNNMELLYRVLHAVIPEACRAARLPKRHRATIKLMAKAERMHQGTEAGFVPLDIPVTDEVLLRKRVSKVTVLRRSIRESVTRICQNRRNVTGSLRTTGIATPGEYGDVMSSPMLLRIQDLTRHVWAASGVPENKQLTLWTAISGDGTDITRGGGFGVEASTLTILNLERDTRTSKGNVKLLSVYRIPSLHNPTVASQKKKKYKPTTAEYQALK